MANPQTENGFTKIANEILEALIRTSLSGQELKIALLVIRKTYGFSKKVDFISLTQMAKALACSKIRCAQVVKNLETMKVLTVNENINHNINITKESYCPTSNEVRLSELLLSLIRQKHENFKQPDIQKWAGHVDKLIRIDKRPVEEIEKVIAWCQADSFWHVCILSTYKLREKYDQLYLKAFSGNGKSTSQTRYY